MRLWSSRSSICIDSRSCLSSAESGSSIRIKRGSKISPLRAQRAGAGHRRAGPRHAPGNLRGRPRECATHLLRPTRLGKPPRTQREGDVLADAQYAETARSSGTRRRCCACAGLQGDVAVAEMNRARRGLDESASKPRSVVFPDPDGPRRETNSRGATLSVTLSSARTAP